MIPLKVRFTETVLRDAHQSLMATRMTTEEMLPILKELDEVGYYALECWGGATFDSAIRFLNEDPWERLRLIRDHTPNTPLMMLLRGQNILGYRHYADDIVDKFIEKAIVNGIDIFRIFDALNDTRNLEKSIEAVKKYGGHAQIAICYTTSPVHTVTYYTQLTKELVEMGADSICIKDMAGILTPKVARELVPAIKGVIGDLPLEMHTHATSGTSEMTYLVSVEAGADIIDTAISPLSGGTSQPATESLNEVFQEMGYDTNLNKEKLESIADYFKPIRQKYLDNKTINPRLLTTDPKALMYQVPGGMLSNLSSQMMEAGAYDRYEEVLAEVPRVRKELGYPPLVTPLSQMVGTQAVFNILTGERYKMVPNEIKDYLKGRYGRSPAPIDPDIQKLIIGEDEEIIDVRPADLIGPGFESEKEKIGDLAENDEDVLMYALFPQNAKTFLENRRHPQVEKDEPIRIRAKY